MESFEADPNLVLVSPGPGRAGRAVYGKSYSAYVAELERAGMPPANDAERKIKRWVSDGRAASDMPPLDNLPQMANWWRRRKTWKVPDYLLRLEQVGEEPLQNGEAGAESAPVSPLVDSPAVETPASGPEAVKTGAAKPMEAIPSMVAVGADYDVGNAVGLLRSLAASFAAQMKRAGEKEDNAGFYTAFDRYKKTMADLRQWEKDLAQIQESRGDVLRTREMNEVLGRMFSVAALSFTNVMMALAKELAPDLDPETLRAKVWASRDRCFVHLKKSRFASAYPG